MRLAFRWPRRMYPFHGRQGMPAEARRRLFDWARAAGFEGTEVSTAHVRLFELSDAELSDLRAEVESHGLAVAACNPGGRDFTNPATRQERLDYMYRAVEITALLGASILNTTVPTQGGFERGSDLPENWDIGARTAIAGAHPTWATCCGPTPRPKSFSRRQSCGWRRGLCTCI